MKAYRFLPLLALPALAALTACDDVAEDDRIIPVDRIESDRVVLLQEFSGQRCRNCPDGADAIHSILAEYPDNVVAVSMHPAGTTFSGPYRGTDITCDEATYMYDFYNRPTEFPYAIVNGNLDISEESNRKNYNVWATMTIMAMLQAPEMSLEVEATYDAATRTVTATYSAEALEELYDGHNIMVWLTENDIVAAQDVHGRPVNDYVSNHILRASFNGEAGESIGSDFLIGQKAEGSVSLVLDEKWVPENCEVVAYVYRPSDKYVLQAAKCPAVPGASSH